MALESLLESRDKTLEALARMEISPPREALLALAENLALTFLAEPENSALQALYGRLTDLLTCFDLSLVTDVNGVFDPEKHEACAVRRDFSRAENTVLEVVRPGFLLRDRVLRCATVVVNRRGVGLDETGGSRGPLSCNAGVFWEEKTGEGEFDD